MWSEYTNEARKSSSSFQGSSEQSMRSNCDHLESSENEKRRGEAGARPREKRASRGQRKRRSFSMYSEGDSASSTEVPPENETLPARSPSPGRPKSRLKGVERGHPDKRDRAGRTPLIKYANLGDLDSCEELLELGAAINVKDNAGWTALHEAALAGHYTLLNVLLRHGAELNIRADNGDTPLHDSVQNGHIDCVQALLEAGADPEISNDEGVTPITAADDGLMLELLLQYQALRRAAKVEDKSGRAALHRAAAEGLLQDVVAILRYGGAVDAVDYAGRAALHEACSGGHVDVVKALLAAGAGFDADSAGLTPLHHAIRGRHLDCVRELLIAGANPWAFDQDGKTAFDFASDFPPASDMLIQWRFSASDDKESASNGDVSSVYWRMAGRDSFSGSTREVSGPDGDSSSSRNFQHTQQDAEGRREHRGSISSGFRLRPRRRPQYAERMVDSEDDVSNYSEEGSSSSLSSAGGKNDARFMPSKSSSTNGAPSPTKRKTTPRQTVDVLPSSKERRSPCKRQRRDTSGSGITPLHVYASKSDAERMRALLANGTDPSPRDNAGYTPLHEAALRGHAEVVQALIVAGADVAARGYEGDTPLHDAAQNGHRKVYRILVKAGADEDALNVKGQRPRDFFKSRDDSAVKQQLKARDRTEKRKADTRRRCRSEGVQTKNLLPAQEKLGGLLPDGRSQDSPALTGEYSVGSAERGAKRAHCGVTSCR
ncbi:MAG: ankyrin repeat-containing domain protein [Olpidium bornovanus]|uniref:Ankyrin repeat-containing domain protein n=1 Tax=Olpidium bornovanus TaxID=278681 RepID=A0A8H7ZPC3_9FUNG|nr:MAG: ankyrin repeat-containing domain protein [Olpidium bornovanus]